jgi:membrane-bound lytic murein transglycosylase D
MIKGPTGGKSDLPTYRIDVWIEQGQAKGAHFSFHDTFHIGRDRGCDVQILGDPSVSRQHIEVSFHDDSWWLRDVDSTNGTYVDDRKINVTPLTSPTKVRLGTGATLLSLIPLASPSEVADAGSNSLTRYVRHYFTASNLEHAGRHTKMIRRAFELVQIKEKRKYTKIIILGSVLLLFAIAYAFYLYIDTAKQRARAEAIFYAMKSLELDIAGIQQIVTESRNDQGIQVINKYRDHRKEMEKNYEQYLGALGFYSPQLTEPERLILRVARIFGECEINMPPGFAAEVQNYIRKWQSSGRLEKAIRTAQEKSYRVKISEAMLSQGLPPQFFYLALQESNFDIYSVGPKTYKGHAKGMWQFIPETAIKYGLRVGPLVDLGRPDPRDERHNFEKATNAAALYLKFIYSTDAQASGLLVMSSYNWGEEKVVKLLRSMPANPKDRNFWRLLTSYRDKIPQETYDYVFYIVSAAVIGENPRLFGFKFDNPLATTEQKTE